jgi:hypothetical protein
MPVSFSTGNIGLTYKLSGKNTTDGGNNVTTENRGFCGYPTENCGFLPSS